MCLRMADQPIKNPASQPSIHCIHPCIPLHYPSNHPTNRLTDPPVRPSSRRSALLPARCLARLMWQTLPLSSRQLSLFALPVCPRPPNCYSLCFQGPPQKEGHPSTTTWGGFGVALTGSHGEQHGCEVGAPQIWKHRFTSARLAVLLVVPRAAHQAGERQLNGFGRLMQATLEAGCQDKQ